MATAVELLGRRRYRPPLPPASAIGGEMRLLVSRCWHADAFERPSFAQVVTTMERMQADQTRLSGGDLRAFAGGSRGATDAQLSLPPAEGFPFEGELLPCYSAPEARHSREMPPSHDPWP